MTDSKLGWWHWAVLILLILIFLVLLIFVVAILMTAKRIKHTLDTVLCWSNNLIYWSNQIFNKIVKDLNFLEDIIKEGIKEFNTSSHHLKELGTQLTQQNCM